MADFSWYVLSFTSLVVLALAPVKADTRVYMYKRVGDSVTLKCNNVIKSYEQCSSTTWLYSRDGSKTIELVGKGKWRQDNLSGSKASRLSLQPDCLLNISVINVEDAGLYVCQQYDSIGRRYGSDENIYLSVLSGITQKDYFTCSVYCYDSTCKGLTLSWSNQGTVDKRSHLETPGQCVTTLPNAETLDSAGLRCLLMKNGVVETSVDFASKDQRILPHPNTTSGGPGGPGPPEVLPISLAVAVGTGVLILIVAVLLLRRKKSTGNTQSPPKCAEDHNTTESTGKAEPTACPSIGQGEPEGLTYASIDHWSSSRKAQRHSGGDGGSDGDETVTYSTILKPIAKVPAQSCR